MSDYVPENDRLEQEADVADHRPPAGGPGDGNRALDYPEPLPAEVPEADALEQAQEVPQDEEEQQ